MQRSHTYAGFDWLQALFRLISAQNDCTRATLGGLEANYYDGTKTMLATIGYERAELGDFIATLEACDIEVLVDIRDRAQSRRPGFSKSTLAHALGAAGIEYLHFKELGDPKEGREAARKGDYEAFRQIFSAVMESDAAKNALVELKSLATHRNICLMCFERDQLQCHRKIVSDYLETSLSVKARHLGVVKNAPRRSAERRMCHLDQGAAASV